MPIQITREELINAFALESGNEELLLRKVCSGNKSAIIKLVMLYMPMIVQIAGIIQAKKRRRPVQFLSDMGIVILVNYIEQQKLLVKENKIHEFDNKNIYQLIYDGLENEIISFTNGSTFDVTTEFLH